MTDLMTASGRSAALKEITPALRRLESTLAKQSRPLLKTLGSVETSTLAKLGGGVAAFAAIFYAAQSLLKKPDAKTAKAAVKTVRKATAPAARRARSAAKPAVKRAARKTA